MGVDVCHQAGGRRGPKRTWPARRAAARALSEAFGQAGAGEGVGVAAFGQEAVAAAGDEQEAVQEPVGDLDGVELGGAARRR